jgi:hypothetical protein
MFQTALNFPTRALRICLGPLLCLILCLATPRAIGEIYTWDGSDAASGNWTTAANWMVRIGGFRLAPGPGDDLVFPASASRNSPSASIASSRLEIEV